MNWDEATIANMADLFRGGHSPAHIARAIGTTRNAVIGKICRLARGGDKRFARLAVVDAEFTDAESLDILYRRETCGKSFAAIARKIGRTSLSVERHYAAIIGDLKAAGWAE